MDADSPLLETEDKETPKDADTHTKKTHNQKDKWYERWAKKWKAMTASNKLMSIFTGIIAVCTLVYAIVSGFQLSALLDSNTINRESLQSVQRAYISFQQIAQIRVIYRPPAVDNEAVTYQFRAGLMNAGNTPAKAAFQSFNSGTDEPNEAQFVGTTFSLTGKNVGPKAYHSFGLIEKPAAYFGLQDIKTVKEFHTNKGTPRWFLWGWVTYRDVFPKTKPHITEFCQSLYNVMIVTTLPPNTPIQWQFQFEDCSKHNCADEQCEDYDSFLASDKMGKPN